jgi:hypothetical protein
MILAVFKILIFEEHLIFCDNSNMMSFKRFESTPVVKIILIYYRLHPSYDVMLFMCQSRQQHFAEFQFVWFLDPGICKNTICYSRSSQGMWVYIPCLFSISPEPISNTWMFIYFVYCILIIVYLLQGSVMEQRL